MCYCLWFKKLYAEGLAETVEKQDSSPETKDLVKSFTSGAGVAFFCSAHDGLEWAFPGGIITILADYCKLFAFSAAAFESSPLPACGSALVGV
jgi:hypothetical protein